MVHIPTVLTCFEPPVHLPAFPNSGPLPGRPADAEADRPIDRAMAPTDPAASTPPRDIVAWALSRFRTRLIVTTGFGMEGCVLIDMLWNLAGAPGGVTVHYLDTHFLFPETHALRARLEQRYPGLRFINAGTSYTPQQQEREYGAELWRSDPDRCCTMRKVEPMRRLLMGGTADAWMTAVRRSQSETRAAVNPVEWDARFGVIKINPLAAWSREQVWDYAVANGVPYNELHEQGYPSIGCTHCTRPVPGAAITDYSRSGRWAGTAKTECGLHWNSAGEGI